MPSRSTHRVEILRAASIAPIPRKQATLRAAGRKVREVGKEILRSHRRSCPN